MSENDQFPARTGGATKLIQDALQELWNRAQTAAQLLAALREENSGLQEENRTLRASVSDLEQKLEDTSNQLEESRNASGTIAGIDVGERLLYLSPDEREALERQIDDLLQRINTHLGSGSR
jgi:hypothetical protein